MSTVQASPLAIGERGELIPDDKGLCPCGAPMAPGQIWTTEWYDSLGLVERWVVTRLCNEHRARVGLRGPDTT